MCLAITTALLTYVHTKIAIKYLLTTYLCILLLLACMHKYFVIRLLEDAWRNLLAPRKVAVFVFILTLYACRACTINKYHREAERKRMRSLLASKNALTTKKLEEI